MTELQSRASGSSVFGRVVGAADGLYDPYGMTACGIPGATICLADSSICTESDAAGQFVLQDLPDNTPAEITIEKPSFLASLRLATLGSSPINLYETLLRKEGSGTATLAGAGVAVNPALGSLVATALTAGEAIGGIVLAGHATMALEPDNARALYSIGKSEPSGLSSAVVDPSLTETREGGWGLFVNLTAGEYGVRIERNGAQCASFVPGYSLGTDTQGNLAVRVREGFTTTAAAYCP